VSISLSHINAQNFNEIALGIFQFQLANNEIYRDFCQSIRKIEVQKLEDIPFLSISFFKTHQVTCYPNSVMDYFESSGTSGMQNSKHFIQDIKLYEESISLGFQHFFQDKKYTIVGLLPHYLERANSSLVYMVKHWMSLNQQKEYFYLHNLEELKSELTQLLAEEKPILLIGISFGLLDLAAIFQTDSSNLTIIETGGMKGSRPEILKSELVAALRKSFSNAHIISEYGMCELFSQAYSDENLWFSCPPWMRIYVSEPNDPMTLLNSGTGVAKIIDLANRDSCSFIETQDLIHLNENGKFQIIGRIDNSDVRGCSLMYS